MDIYVIGSNARFLSKDVITTLRGRGEEIRVYPFSFKEYLQTTEISMPLALNTYMLYGSIPQVTLENDEKRKRALLKSLFPNTYLTMVAYLEYICDSFITERAERFDIKGKRYINNSYK